MAGQGYNFGGRQELRAGLDRQRRTNQLNEFAELISRDDEEGPLSPADAAERMGLPRHSGNGMMQRLRQQMGPQAI